MLKIENLCKSFRTEDVETIALNNVSFTVEDGEFVALWDHQVVANPPCSTSSVYSTTQLRENISWVITRWQT